MKNGGLWLYFKVYFEIILKVGGCNDIVIKYCVDDIEFNFIFM